MTPYRIAPARPVPASRSWWRNAWRLYRVQRAWQVHGWARFLWTIIVTFVAWQAMRLAFSPARGSAMELAVAVLSWPVADLLLGQCSTDCPRGTLTTFPALAAYRELVRTCDVEAFAAKDLRPVTRPIASLVGDAEAVMDAARRVGRKTAEGLPRLQGRKLVFVSRAGVVPPKLIAADNRVLHVRTTVEDAVAVARETDPEPIVIGGAEVYRAAMRLVSRIYLTEIDRAVDGDTRFDLDRTGFVETERRQGEERDVAFVTLERELP